MKKFGLPNFMYPYWGRVVGLTIIMAGTIIFLLRALRYEIVDWAGASFPLAMGLMLIFFSKGKDFDERIAYLKLKSLAAAVPVAAVVVMVINYIHNYNGYSIETDSWFSISAFEYLAITLATAIVWFHYLKVRE